MSFPDVVIIAGPTAVGKTAVGIELAERLGGEIIGADSRQIYAGMPIGTATPTSDELARVPHHLIGFLDPHERYSAAQFVIDAGAAIEAIRARGRLPIVVGGTGFYLRALCGEVTLGSNGDPAVRARLAREVQVHPPHALHAWLTSLDADRAHDISPNDPYRITRALELALARTNEPSHARTDLPTLPARGLRFEKIVLACAPETLHARIDARTDAMLERGFVEEAERVGAGAVAADAVGYRDALAYLAGAMDAPDLRAILARATRRYAKRQLTWFRGESGAHWLDAVATPVAEALAIITRA